MLPLTFFRRMALSLVKPPLTRSTTSGGYRCGAARKAWQSNVRCPEILLDRLGFRQRLECDITCRSITRSPPTASSVYVKIHISASSGRTRGRLKVKNGEIFAFSLRALGTVHPLLLVTELFGPRIARRIVGDALAHHQPLHQPFRRSFHLPRPRAKRQAEELSWSGRRLRLMRGWGWAHWSPTWTRLQHAEVAR